MFGDIMSLVIRTGQLNTGLFVRRLERRENQLYLTYSSYELRFELEYRRFDFRWRSLGFIVDIMLPAAL
jgi:hypothetical protein